MQSNSVPSRVIVSAVLTSVIGLAGGCSNGPASSGNTAEAGSAGSVGAGGASAGGTNVAGASAGSAGIVGGGEAGGIAGDSGSSAGGGGSSAGTGGSAGAGGSAPLSKMTFFLTSSNPGSGAQLGGLAGADAHCQTLATAAGGGDHTWHAYLSASGPPAVNAKDRIGAGPWVNRNGVTVATSVADLHSPNNLLGKANSVDEKGATVNGAGDQPNRHDSLTGSTADGSAYPAETDRTCKDWTSDGAGTARVGHHDKAGSGQNPMSWNSAHDSNGCSLANLRSTGGDGRFYCFAVDETS